jgi:phenylacetate-CoA ligase
VICTAEPLHDWQRATIHKALGCIAFQHYGTRDFGLVAAECERHSGMHVNPGSVIIEQLPVNSGENEGLRELVVTDLLNYGMPMIRYRINDCTIAGPEMCDCGRTYPLIQPIIGRTLDNFFLADGSVVPGILLLRVVKQLPGLKQAQVIQDAFDRFEVKYVRTDLFSPDQLNTVAEKLKSFCGRDIVVIFSEVNEVPREKSGKTRFCISHVRAQQPVEVVGAQASERIRS